MSHHASFPKELAGITSRSPGCALGSAPSTSPRMHQMHAHIRAIHDLLTPAECNALILAASARGFSAPDFSPGKRRCTRLHTVDTELSAAIMARLRPFLPELVVVDGVRWGLGRFTHHWRYVRYEAGGHFAPHYDGAKMLPSHEMTMFTVQLYLNDDFTGGSTRFYVDHTPVRHASHEIGYGTVGDFRPTCDVTHSVAPETGKALVFNHAENVLHDGEPVREGIKYILRGDVLYRALDEDRGLLSSGADRMWCEKTAGMRGTRNYVGEVWRCRCGEDDCGGRH